MVGVAGRTATRPAVKARFTDAKSIGICDLSSHPRQDPMDWKSGLASAVGSAAGDFLGQFWDNDKRLGQDTDI